MIKFILVQPLHSNPWRSRGSTHHQAGEIHMILVEHPGKELLATIFGWLHCKYLSITYCLHFLVFLEHLIFLVLYLFYFIFSVFGPLSIFFVFNYSQGIINHGPQRATQWWHWRALWTEILVSILLLLLLWTIANTCIKFPTDNKLYNKTDSSARFFLDMSHS